ncbi:MAG TPA: amidohydrolase family protein [Stellaceae bacterium]|jgi:predicted TIM-barrel fold metal-dependent hydrolase|nr:amidohydrolase family protein [Stellaceae bacterium]
MLIVDAQIHLWSKGSPPPHHRQTSHWTAEEALREMAEAGVDAGLIHPPGWDSDCVAVAEAAAAKYPNKFAILGHFPPEKPESRGLVAGWKNRPGMLGLRWAFTQPHQQTWLTDGTMDWLWPECEKAGIPVALMASTQLPLLGEIAGKHPGLKLIIDHYGRNRNGKDDEAHANQAQLLALAKHKNIAVKCTGAPGNSSHPYPFRNIHKYTQQIVETFGPERSFWGTDITRMPCSWRQCVTMFTEEMSWLKGRDLDLVMGRALCDWIGWKLPG